MIDPHFGLVDLCVVFTMWYIATSVEDITGEIKEFGDSMINTYFLLMGAAVLLAASWSIVKLRKTKGANKDLIAYQFCTSVLAGSAVAAFGAAIITYPSHSLELPILAPFIYQTSGSF